MKKSIVFILMIVVLVWSCKKTSDPANTSDATPPQDQNIVSKNMTTGSFTEVSNSTVGLSGATVKIAKPGTPVDGIEIAIPANSFSSSLSLKVAYAEIKSHQFGANFNPISPIISITCDGGYSNELMSITIPVKIPVGHIPLGFYLDETTGKLEGIPFKSITANSITLLTRHFLNANKLKSGELNLKNLSGIGANIVICSISESVLNGQSIIATGYKPGVDDWEFVNYGSYIAPGGHCAGQNMTAMWYYFEKKPSEGNLFNKFSDNPKLWQDNARGYRFCSVMQNDIDQAGFFSLIIWKYITFNQDLDKLKLLTIAGAMLVTGEPQGIGIFRQKGLKPDGTPSYEGHNLICYQVSVSSGKLYISDPNKPGLEQSIDFKNNKFDPYIARVNGNAASNPYPFVTYYAKTAFIEWDKIGKRYAELLDNTIGTKAPNTFPNYTLWVKDGTGYELKDGLRVTKDTLRINAICPGSEAYYEVQNQKLIGINVYNQDGLVVSKGTEYAPYVKLTPGLNKIGFYIYAWKNNNKYANGDDIPLFVDFKWITVNYSPLSIDPNPLQGILNTDYKLTARSKGTAPKSAKYIWDFGDGSAKVTIQNDSTSNHTYTKEGVFNVKVELYDNAVNLKINEASSIANITPASINLSNLQKTRSILVYGKCTFTWTNGQVANLMNIGNVNDKNNPIKWNNRDFSVTYTREEVSPPSVKIIYYYSFSGTVSDDGKKLVTFSHDYKCEYYVSNKWSDTESYKYTVTNIPLTESANFTGWRIQYTLPKEEVASHVSSFDYHFSDSFPTKLDFLSMKQYNEQFYVIFYENF
ncbi:MAG: PKD domain-containing protein [Prolixibacteraceae bacterium]